MKVVSFAGTVVVTMLCVSAATQVLTTRPEAVARPATGPTLCLVGDRGMTVGAAQAPIDVAARTELAAVPGVDGAYLQERTEEDEGVTINVLSREHGLIDREALFGIEDRLAATFGAAVTFIVRAHQGRDMRSLAGPNLLFARA